MIDRGIGKAKEDFVCDCFLQLIVIKQIRQHPIRVIAADRAQYHINLRITERFQEVFSPFLGMRLDVLQPHECIRHKCYIQPIIFQSLKADINLEPDK